MREYPTDDKGWQKYWIEEITAATKRLETFHQRAEKVVSRFLDDRKGSPEGGVRLNLFHSNTTVLKSMMFGQLPKVDVGRTFQDADDDVGRVASLIMQRLLTNDIAANGSEYTTVLRAVLEDRLLPGLACARVRYVAEFGEASTDPLTGEELPGELLWEDAPSEYYHWRDVLWGWTRSWAEMPWLAFRTYLSCDEFEKRFGEDKAKQVEYKQRVIEGTRSGDQSGHERSEQMETTEVYEVWCAKTRSVYWVAMGQDALLDKQADPLGLKNFYPAPPFLMANCTTTLYEPVPDFYIVQDLYNEIDTLETRINIITKAVKLAGVYDASKPEIQRLVTETMDNDLVPVENWALMAERRGLDGVIDWMPLQEVVNTLHTLEQVRDSKIALLFQIIGLSDIMRGMGTDSSVRVSAAEQTLKAKFGSIRVQAMQDQFAQFATDLLQVKCEVISKHFDKETIGYMAVVNGLNVEDLKLVPQALDLIKDWEMAGLRIKIRPESVAMTDYAALQQERTAFINNLALFMQSAAPLVEQAPEATPVMLEMLKWGLAGFKASNEIEGVLDRAIEGMRKNPPQKQGQQDNTAQIEQMKLQAAVQKIQMSLKADIQKIQAKLQADMALLQAKTSAEGQKEVNQAMSARIEELGQLEAKVAEMDFQRRGELEVIDATVRADKDRIRMESRARRAEKPAAA